MSGSQSVAHRPLRDLARWTMRLLAVAAVLILVFTVVGYLASARLIAVLASGQASMLALDELAVDSERPALDGLRIRQLKARAGAITIEVQELRVGWDTGWIVRALRCIFTGASECLSSVVAELTLVADRGAIRIAAAGVDEQTRRERGAPAIEDPLKVLPIAPPVAHLELRALTVDVEPYDFRSQGTLSWTPTGLAARMEAQAPVGIRGVRASIQVSPQGVIDLAVMRPERTAEPLLSIRTALPDGRLQADVAVQLEEPVVAWLVQAGGLPSGEGSVAGRFHVALPWPLPAAIDWSHIDAAGTLQLRWRSEEPGVEVSVPTITGTLAAGRLDAEVEGTVQIPAGDPPGVNALVLNPENLRADLSAATLSTGGFLQWLGEPVSADGRYELDLHLDRENALGFNAEFDGTLSLPNGSVPVSAEIEGTREATGSVQAEAFVDGGPLSDVPIRLTWSAAPKALSVAARHSQDIQGPFLSRLLPDWPEAYDLDSGRLLLTGAVHLDPEGVARGSVDVEIRSGRGRLGDGIFQGLDTTLRIQLAGSDVRLNDSPLGVRRLDLGVPVTELQGTLSGTASRLLVGPIEGRLLGGRITVAPFEYDLEAQRGVLVITLHELDLAEVLALEGEHITGSGRLSGRLPVSVQGDRLEVRGGKVRALPPGGRLHLDPALASGGVQPELALALRALTHFEYDVLEADVGYSPSGDLNLSVRLEGRNPQMEGGRPIHFNLNVTENVPALLESLRLADSFNERIEARTRR